MRFVFSNIEYWQYMLEFRIGAVAIYHVLVILTYCELSSRHTHNIFHPSVNAASSTGNVRHVTVNFLPTPLHISIEELPPPYRVTSWLKWFFWFSRRNHFHTFLSYEKIKVWKYKRQNWSICIIWTLKTSSSWVRLFAPTVTVTGIC